MKLFAILASYLKGRCLSLVKSMAKSKDGFKLRRALLQEYEPSSRQRSLALAQTLSNYPAFSGSKTILEQILSYEQLVQQFEEASSSTYPAELKNCNSSEMQWTEVERMFAVDHQRAHNVCSTQGDHDGL